MALSAKKLLSQKERKDLGILRSGARNPAPGAPLRVTMVDGKVRRQLRSDRDPIVRRLCSGSNAIVIRLSIRSTIRATATARMGKVTFNLPARDREHRAWSAASSLFQSPMPAGEGRILIGSTARFVGRGRSPLSARLKLAQGSCYHLQVRAETGSPLRFKVSDADDKTLLSQSLSPKRSRAISSEKICPRRTEAHRLILSGAGPVRVVAWRLVGKPLGGTTR